MTSLGGNLMCGKDIVNLAVLSYVKLCPQWDMLMSQERTSAQSAVVCMFIRTFVSALNVCNTIPPHSQTYCKAFFVGMYW